MLIEEYNAILYSDEKEILSLKFEYNYAISLQAAFEKKLSNSDLILYLSELNYKKNKIHGCYTVLKWEFKFVRVIEDSSKGIFRK